MTVRLTSRIKRINVDAQVHGLCGTDAVFDPLDNTIGSNFVNLPGLNDLEATVAVVLVVRGSRQRRANAGVDVGVVGKKTFLRCVEEVGAVVNAGLLSG